MGVAHALLMHRDASVRAGSACFAYRDASTRAGGMSHAQREGSARAGSACHAYKDSSTRAGSVFLPLGRREGSLQVNGRTSDVAKAACFSI